MHQDHDGLHHQHAGEQVQVQVVGLWKEDLDRQGTISAGPPVAAAPTEGVCNGASAGSV